MICTIPIHEFNPCHEPGGQPTGGQFCATTGDGKMRVGITSARPKDNPGYKENRQVFADMRAFEGQLNALPGVRDATVKPGLGVWDGGKEATWVVAYHGNGEATKLIARTAKGYDQDAVLMFKGCTGGDCSPAVEITFDTGVSLKVRDAIHEIIAEHRNPDGSPVIGGWTWYKRNGKTMLRMVAVPQWGGNTQTHLRATTAISQSLTKLGVGHRNQTKAVKVIVMTREGDTSYDRFTSGSQIAESVGDRHRRYRMGGRTTRS